MSDQGRKGFWAKLFGKKPSCCCGVQIEEVTEDQETDGTESKQQAPASDKPAAGSCCHKR